MNCAIVNWASCVAAAQMLSAVPVGARPAQKAVEQLPVLTPALRQVGCFVNTILYRLPCQNLGFPHIILTDC